MLNSIFSSYLNLATASTLFEYFSSMLRVLRLSAKIFGVARVAYFKLFRSWNKRGIVILRPIFKGRIRMGAEKCIKCAKKFLTVFLKNRSICLGAYQHYIFCKIFSIFHLEQRKSPLHLVGLPLSIWQTIQSVQLNFDSMWSVVYGKYVL